MPRNLIGCPVTARIERTAPSGITFDLGQNDAREADLLIELARHIHGILAGHRIGNQQDFVGIDGLL